MTALPATTPSALAPLRLKKNEDRRLRAGHLWVYSNEVDVAATPLKSFEPGQPVEIQAANGKPLGSGYVNPHSLICARLVSRDPRHALDRSLIVHRLKVALSLRERLFDEPFYRLAYGESDGLPGLVVDRYGDVFVVQCNTAGMERVRDVVLEALERLFAPRGVLLRNDSAVREHEALPRYRESRGEVPGDIEVPEGGARFGVSLDSGQKTGWFFDQRMNRDRFCAYVAGCRVLDLFSYVGAWGVRAARAGASEVLCVDGSEAALARVRENAARNGVAARVGVEPGDAFEVLAALRARGERFDVVVADPPAFIKKRRDQRSGEQAYRRLNELAMRVLSRDGLLVSASCSAHLEETVLQRMLLRAARHLDRDLRVLERGQQAPDHPVHPAIPETRYLKTLFCRVLPASC